MRIMTIELNPQWLLSHKDDDELPLARLQRELERFEALDIKEAHFDSLIAVYDEREVKETELSTFVDSYFDRNYPDAVSETGEVWVSVSYRYYEPEKKDDDETDAAEGNEDGKDDRDEELEEIEELLDKTLERMEKKAGKGPSLPEDISALVGAAEFKELLGEIQSVAKEIRRTNTIDVFLSRCYLFSIGEGCGLSTYLKFLAKVVKENVLSEMSSRAVIEERIPAYVEGKDPFAEAKALLRNGSLTSVKLVCFDISEWMDKTDDRLFKQFLRTVEKSAGEFIVVFRVPFVDKDFLSRIQYGLSDLLNVKAVSFPPFNREEIKKCAELELKRYGFSFGKETWKMFFDSITAEKSDGKFYGINTVKKVVRSFIYAKQLENAKKGRTDNRISRRDVKGICSTSDASDLSGMEQLERLVGSDSIKTRVEEIIAQIELSLRETSLKPPCIHMRFVGNPGTGKTTVARILGKILKERGVLRCGGFFEYAGRDFCGRYIGETAPKTACICRDAYGSVLFIDEAYSLYRGDDDSRDYGLEALDTLIAEMENHRNDFVVIMAGYTDDMEKLMKGNLGLASRMPYTIEFPNFTREQLYEIFESMVKEKFKYDNQLLEVARTYFTNLAEETVSAKEFANARFVRNLFERTWAKAAMRCQLSGKQQIVLTKEDFEHASAEKEFVVNQTKKARIGF